MVSETVEKKLHGAARIGDVVTLQQLLQRNQHLLDVVSFSCLRNVLHIAIKQGQESIAEEVLNINPELALGRDSENSSCLHIAAANGNVEIAKRLLSIAPEMCWWRDSHDMNPIHVAAMKGKAEVLKEMLHQDSFPAAERLHRGQTVLHLCVKHRQIGTLKVLVEKLGDLVCAADEDGETLLHFAVRANQLEIVRYLVESNKIGKLAKNSMGKTAVDILDESFKDTSTYSEMIRILHRLSYRSFLQSVAKSLPKFTNMTMVVAVLIATMAFQAGISPPGGVWQEDTSSHSAGQAVMATTHPKIYKYFIRANTMAFITSILSILNINTGLAQIEFFFLWMTTSLMLTAIISIGVSYGASLIMTNPKEIISAGFIVATVGYDFITSFVIALVYFPLLYRLIPWSNSKISWLLVNPTTTPDNFLIRAWDLWVHGRIGRPRELPRTTP